MMIFFIYTLYIANNCAKLWKIYSLVEHYERREIFYCFYFFLNLPPRFFPPPKIERFARGRRTIWWRVNMWDLHAVSRTAMVSSFDAPCRISVRFEYCLAIRTSYAVRHATLRISSENLILIPSYVPITCGENDLIDRNRGRNGSDEITIFFIAQISI